jgi:wyosine [tRNA(Phe)-imidazoG37] synthetase (radical SAM superfamily)
VDPVPLKTCCYNCVYCQLGRTTNLTAERQPYVPAATLIDELAAWLARGEPADVLTLSGSGEPTLNSEIGEVVRWARHHTAIPIAVLTNGALLWQADVRRDIWDADLLIPSLDAATEDTFRRLNRPAAGLELDQVVEGLVAARRECRGEMWLEIMMVAGFNDRDEELAALRRAVDRIQPRRVQINTVARPPAEASARPLSNRALRRIRERLGPRAELVRPRRPPQPSELAHAAPGAILALLRRRPCTVSDIAAALSLHPNEVAKLLEQLLAAAAIGTVTRYGASYYVATADDHKVADTSLR